MKTLYSTIVKISCLLCLLLNINSYSAATKTSTTSGNFNAGATWVGGVAPTTSDDVIIATGHTVTLTTVSTPTLTSITIQAGAIVNNSTFQLSLNDGGGAAPNYTNNGTHNGTGTIYLNNGTSRFTGTGVTNCSIEIDQNSGVQFLTGCTLTINGNIFSPNLVTSVFNLQNYGNIILNGDITTSTSAHGTLNNYAGASITQTGNVTLNYTAAEENHGIHSITGNLVLGDNSANFWNQGGAVLTVGGDLLGSGSGLSHFLVEATSIVKFGGAVFPTGNDGDLLVSGISLLTSLSCEPNTVEYNGGVNQVIKTPSDGAALGGGYSANTYSKLVLSNTSTKTLESNTIVNADLILRNTSQLDVFASNYSLNLKGNFTDSSTNANPFVERSGTVTFSGTAAQSITSRVAGGQTFYNLTINNTSTGVTLANAGINVSNILNLTSGKIHTGAYECAVTNTALAAITNYSSTKYINGKLRRSLLSGGGSYNFPIGNSDSYQLATLNIATGNTAGNILGFFSNAVTGTGLPLVEGGYTYNSLLDCGGTAPGTGNANGGIWTFTPDAGTATYDLTLNARNYSNSLIHQTIAKRANSGAAWALLGTLGSWSGSEPLIVNRTAYSGFSDFAIISAVSPLPIELSAISAKCEQSKTSNSEYGATIQWTTDTEINSDYFIIERSENTIDWDIKDTIDGSGTKYDPTNYYYHDNFINPTPENETTVYYRVSQTDFDGVVNTYNILSCKCEASDKIKIHPVPATEYIIVNFGDQNNVPNSFQITDMFGRIIQEVSVGAKEGNTSYKLDISNYSSGRYIIKINDWKMKEDAVFIKK